LQGSPERIRLAVELAAERTLGPFGEVLELDAKALEQRRRRLERLGKQEKGIAGGFFIVPLGGTALVSGTAGVKEKPENRCQSSCRARHHRV
jgi:hypothetical protein